MNTIQRFIKERKYLSNVSPATIDWYEYCLKWMRYVERVRVYLDSRNADPVTALWKGKTVTIRGELTMAGRYDITLMSAELLKGPKI